MTKGTRDTGCLVETKTQHEATMHITVTQQHNGTLLSTIHNGQYFKKLYIGYTLKEAKRNFRNFVRNA